ncbi:MAG: cell division protein FtsQ/DivIB [Eubacteriales bacterium]|nr:cell division protein FtsQ/DivIB [Eubacteriales bacterium]
MGIVGTILAVIFIGLIVFFSYYKVEHIEVMASTHYSEEEIKKLVLKGPFRSNSVLAPIFCSKSNTEEVAFVEGYSVKQINRNTIAVSIKEKHPVGCIPYLDSYVYFDRSGIFIEGSKTRVESVPYFDGIEVNKVVMDEKISFKNKTILNTAVALSTIFQKNELIPDHIVFDANNQISLIYDDITVILGADEQLENKMARIIAIFPSLKGKKGTLHAENIRDKDTTLTFEEYKEPVTYENWTGGYDENGDYDGIGEYDEQGNHVGARPPKPEGQDEENKTESDEESEDQSEDSDEDSYSDDSYSDDSYSEDNYEDDYSDYSYDEDYDDYY